MVRVSRLLLLISLNLLSVACVSYGDDSYQDNAIEASGESALTLCEEPRPQICTREYNPVCASLNDGTSRTDATGCTSCSDHEVTGYTMGACEAAGVD